MNALCSQYKKLIYFNVMSYREIFILCYHHTMGLGRSLGLPTTYIVTITELCHPSTFAHYFTFLSLTVSVIFENLICICITKWSHLCLINSQMVNPTTLKHCYRLHLALAHLHMLSHFLSPSTHYQMVAMQNPFFSHQEASLWFNRNTIPIS